MPRCQESMQNKRSCDHLGKHNLPDQAGNPSDWQQCHQPRQRLREEEEKVWDGLDQQPSAFLALGTDFVEDNFSMD